MSRTTWRTIDFRPATPGWRAIEAADYEPGWRAVPIAGWLVEEEAELTPAGDDVRPIGDCAPEDRDRRVVAAVHDGHAEPMAADLVLNLWYIAGPGEPDPTAEDVQQHREQQRIVAARRAAR